MRNGTESVQAMAPRSAGACRGRWVRTRLQHICGLPMVLCWLVMAAAGTVWAAEPPLTPEYIKEHYPDLYRQIQAAPKLPPTTDPQQPYGEYGGFLAHPRFLPGQPEDWWENSSFEYSPEYPYHLKHTHLKFSFARMTGNDDGSAIKGGVYLGLRKGRLTNHLAYEIDKKEITSSDGSSSHKDTQSFEETLQYELNRYLFVEGGMFWQRLSQFYIQDRFLPFVGIGSYNVLQDLVNKKTDRLGLRVGIGYVMDRYDLMVKNLIKDGSDDYKGVYLRADYTHKFTDQFSYKQNFTLKHAIDRTNIYGITTIPQAGLDEQKAIIRGKTLRFDWRWTNALEFNLNQYVGFLVQYTVAFDSNPWPIANKRDTELLTGFKFAY